MPRLVHVSHLNASHDSPSEFYKSKARGDDLVREADAVFYAPPILICAVVGHILKESVDKITVGGMDFDCKFR